MIKEYRIKPFSVEAIQYNGMNTDEIVEWCSEAYVDSYGINVRTVNGMRLLFMGDYLVKNSKGYFKIYNEKLFKKSFEEIPVLTF